MSLKNHLWDAIFPYFLPDDDFNLIIKSAKQCATFFLITFLFIWIFLVLMFVSCVLVAMEAITFNMIIIKYFYVPQKQLLLLVNSELTVY